MKKKHDDDMGTMVPRMPTSDERLRYAAADFARTVVDADPKVARMRKQIERDVLATAKRRRRG